MKLQTPMIFGAAAVSLSACSIFAPVPEPVVVIEEPVVQTAPAAMPMQTTRQVAGVSTAAPEPEMTQEEIDRARRAALDAAARERRKDDDSRSAPAERDDDREWGSR